MTASETSDLTTTLKHLGSRFSGRFGLAARNLATGEEVMVGAEDILPTASVIKLPVLVELYRQVAGGSLDLEVRIPLTAEDRRGGSGILKDLDAGLSPTLRDLAHLMIVLSDNTATNLAIDAVGGIDAVNTTMDDLGLTSIRLHNRIDFEAIGDDVRRLGESSARDMCALLTGIAQRSVFGAEVSEPVETVLGAQQYLDQLARYLDVMPYAAELGLEPRITVACKTGFFPGTRVDAGIVRFVDGGGFSYAVFSHGADDPTFLPEAEGAVFAGLVGKALVQEWWPQGSPVPVVDTAYDASWAARTSAAGARS